jgi:hypothetical protein
MSRFSLLCVALFLRAGALFAQLNPALPPGSNFDLSAWKLQTLGTDFSFIEIAAANLTAGYTSNFFYTDKTDGSMVFRVPSNGSPTSGAHYPRVELRQMTNGANWSLSSSTEKIMTAQCRVLKVASDTKKIVIGQIHGSDTVSELLKLRWVGEADGQCSIDARFKTNDTAKTEYGVVLASGLSLGDVVNYTIKMRSGTITVTANGGSASQTYTAQFFGTTDKYYFKAGDYLQFASTDSTIYGQTQFYKLVLGAGTTGVQGSVPAQKGMALEQNYPNPCNPTAEIRYQLPADGFVRLVVYAVTGAEVPVLVDGMQHAGEHHVQFDGKNLPGGCYFYRLNAGGASLVKKLLLLK